VSWSGGAGGGAGAGAGAGVGVVSRRRRCRSCRSVGRSVVSGTVGPGSGANVYNANQPRRDRRVWRR
jgi:hypothetical protein